MKQYELMLVLRSDCGVDDEKKAEILIGKLIKGATIKEVKLLGKRELAYPIQKQTQGIYFLAVLEKDYIYVNEVEKETRMGTDVLRYLLTVKEGRE